MFTNTDRDIFILGMLAFDEASSEGQLGIRAQIHSVINRHAAVTPTGSPRWYARKTLAGTAFLGYAYSALNTSDPNRVRGAETDMSNSIMQMCQQEAADAIAGNTQDPTLGATHYYAVGTPEPDWVKGLDATGKQVAVPATFTIQIGKHLFYKDVT